MKFDFNSLLRDRIHALQRELDFNEFAFQVDQEQSFLKKKDMAPKTIYVLTRELQNDNSIGVDTQPVQILILAEQNGLEAAMTFFSTFAKTYNFNAYSDEEHAIWVKQQYTDPVVLSNFNSVEYGYRSILYMSATLLILENVVDLHDFKIDDTSYKVLSWDLSYNMSPNTQQLPSEYISKSVKSVSSLALSITIPPVSSNVITKVLSIMNESDNTSTDPDDNLSYGGNENFVFDFWLGQEHFENKKMKLTLVDFNAAVNEVPGIRLGFMK